MCNVSVHIKKLDVPSVDWFVNFSVDISPFAVKGLSVRADLADGVVSMDNAFICILVDSVSLLFKEAVEF